MAGLHQFKEAAYVVGTFPTRFQEEEHGIGEIVAEFCISFHLVENRTWIRKYFWKGDEAIGKIGKRCRSVGSQQRHQRTI